MLCCVWVYAGFLGAPAHGGAITSTIHQLLTGTLSTLTENGPPYGATWTGASSTTTAATSVLVRLAGTLG
jgi:hypothetical protein